ncbi:MAG: helix-turn-helix domain-containing protein [Candidatus Thorarchaeota archaeon]
MRLLHRLAIEPSRYQAELAKELGVTRSAMNQVWKRLEQERQMNVRSCIDYGRLGYAFLFGWAKTDESSTILEKFKGWLYSSPYITGVIESSMSSTMDKRILFEGVVPKSRVISFREQLERFKKQPYRLAVHHDIAVAMTDHMNLAQFNGSQWHMQAGFRFQASIGAAKTFLDVLPITKTMTLTEPVDVTSEEAPIAAALEKKYHVSSRELAEWLKEHKFKCLSGRTLRRKLVELRIALALPYLSVEEIGLTQRVVVCVEEKVGGQPISRLLNAQSSTFPRARIVVGHSLTVLEISLPSDFDWLTMSSSLSMLDPGTTSISTFLTQSEGIRKGLESVLISERKRLE